MAKVYDTRPAHERIAADLRAKILSGDISGKLMSVTFLKQEYETTSNATVQRAIAVLREEGLVVSRQGAGNTAGREHVHTVVAGEYFDPANTEYTYKLLSVTEVPAPADVAAALLIEPGTTVVLRSLLMFYAGDETPVELTYLYFPADLARGTALTEERRIKGGVRAVFAALGIQRTPGRDLVTTRSPTTAELEGLELPQTVPVLRTFRVIRRSDDGAPVEVQVLVKGGHRFGLQYPLPAH